MIALLATILGISVVFAQPPPHQCVYTGGPNNEFVFNLTEIQDWTLELESAEWFFYYTPCRNGVQCHQGNADYHTNIAQYKQGVNGCAYYLAIDHHQPATYAFGGASWHFRFEDGEMCQQTGNPRRTDVYYQCDEEQRNPAYFHGIQEPRLCEYLVYVHSPLACVPENRFNANCQFRAPNGTGGYYTVDLSPLKGHVIHAHSQNGYEYYLSPCDNGLNCYQQYFAPVMALIENRVTNTCDHYLAVWESGRVQPFYHNHDDPTARHWSFHYFNGEKCSNGIDGETTIRYYCDPSAVPYKVINATGDGDCRFEMNVATTSACNPSEEIFVQATLAY